MEKTKSNKKLIIIVAVMVLTVVALAGVLVGVFAATSQTVGTGFSISYDVGTNLAAKGKTQYQIGDGELVTVQGYNPNTNKSYTIDANGLQSLMPILAMEAENQKTQLHLLLTSLYHHQLQQSHSILKYMVSVNLCMN